VAKGFQTGPYERMFFLIMKEGPAYGYELAERFKNMTGGHIRVSYGTIYPFLRRMERKGIIRSKKDVSSGRVYYELTRSGRVVQKKVSRKVKESQREWDEKMLGILETYAQVFGRRSLRVLLKRI
jgi:PadR family transcriptional regulator, regulatory protein PadR